MLPLWLSPTQVRLLPINEGLISHCEEIAGELSGIRVDIDDRTESLGKKIRAAEKEWIPYIIVVGDKEKETGSLAVRDRATGKQTNMSVEELKEIISSSTSCLPHRPLPLPFMVSKRPKFRG